MSYAVAVIPNGMGRPRWLVAGRDHEPPRAEGPLTIHDAFVDYTKEHCLPTHGDPERTWLAFRPWIRVLGHDFECEKVKREHGRLISQFELDRGKSTATALKALTLGMAAMNHAKKEERIKGDLPKFQLPKPGDPRPDWLTREQVRDLFRVKKSPRTHRFLILAFATGVRSEAICELVWERVDFANRTMDFRLPGVDHKNKRRPIAPINDELLPRLLYMYERRDPNDPYVIGANRHGKPGSTYGGCKDALRRIGINKHGVARHVARHTFCSWRVQAGFSYAHIGALVGDTSVMIESVYGHLSPHHLMAASNMDTSMLRVQPTVSIH